MPAAVNVSPTITHASPDSGRARVPAGTFTTSNIGITKVQTVMQNVVEAHLLMIAVYVLEEVQSSLLGHLLWNQMLVMMIGI